ncbi:hypothetical protein C1645_832517, partial [Glomus cerebriforme]
MDFVKNFFHFNKHQSEQKYLSDDIIEQIKDFNCYNLTKKQKLLIDKLILNKKLKKLYKKYDLCKECKQPNTGYQYCQSCESKQEQNFLNEDVFEQIKDFDHHSWKLTEEQKLLIDKLILNEELKERYKYYGLCKECKQPNTGYQYCQSCESKQEQNFLNEDVFEQIKDFDHHKCKQPKTSSGWCNTCNAKRFQQNFKKWSSGNDDIDKFIQHTQLSATDYNEVLEWIPYDRFYNIEYIAKGG